MDRLPGHGFKRAGVNPIGANSGMTRAKKGTSRKSAPKPRCGLCGKTRNLTKTECCGNWICDDEHKYVIFSYARNSCYRNHRRYTLCGSHHAEEPSLPIWMRHLPALS